MVSMPLTTTPLISGPDVQQPVILESGEFYNVMPGSAMGSELIYILQEGMDTVIIFDWEGRKRGEIDLASIVPGNERQFIVGHDGYLYLIDSSQDDIIVMDPLGKPVTVIEIEGLPYGDWVPELQAAGLGSMKIEPSVRAFVDWDGWLIVYDTANSAIYRFALRE